MCLRKALRIAVADLPGGVDVMIWSKGCTLVMRYGRVQAKKISMYCNCTSSRTGAVSSFMTISA